MKETVLTLSMTHRHRNTSKGER